LKPDFESCGYWVRDQEIIYRRGIRVPLLHLSLWERIKVPLLHSFLSLREF
jgi:hypothetical protein